MEIIPFFLLVFVFVWYATGAHVPSFLKGRRLKLETEKVDLDISVGRLAIGESGEVHSALAPIVSLTSPNPDVNTHYVTQYTVKLPERFHHVHIADAESVIFHSLDSYGYPSTGDEIFDASFEWLATPTPDAAKSVGQPAFRDMLTTISRTMGCVRIKDGEMIFRDTGGTSKDDIALTAEVIKGMLDRIR